MELARQVYLLTEDIPKSETFGLRMQLRRSAVSVPCNIAEEHGRLTDAQLRNSLGMARGSLYELQTQIELACDMSFIDPDSKATFVAIRHRCGEAYQRIAGSARTLIESHGTRKLANSLTSAQRTLTC